MIGDFELIERDGPARLCRLETRHGTVETPALLPVVNPNRMIISPSQMRSDFGASMVITNAYIIYRDPELRERAVRQGVHGLLDFDGPVMTDSGTFQTHVYSDVSISHTEILDFQKAIGSDVATVFDVFSEPDFDRGRAENAAETTRQRVEDAVGRGGGDSMIAATVQGSLFPDVREKAARDLGSAGAGYFSIGGVVPLMEGYRFDDLVDVIAASKKGLPPGRPVHLFGAGHPLMLPIAVLMGCDIFDSASYVKYAYDGRMMFPEGSVALSELRYSWCLCPVCSSHTPSELRGIEEGERVRLLATHNLHVLSSELRKIRQAIHEGSLWSMVEQRARVSPQLFDAYAALLSQARYLERFEPLSRRSGIAFVDELTLRRPDFGRFRSSASAVRPGSSKKLLVVKGERQYYTHFDFGTANADEDVASSTRVGIFPIQLTETYPLAQSTYSSRLGCAETPDAYAARLGYTSFRVADGRWRRGGTNSGGDSLMQVSAVGEYQFGIAFTEALLQGKVSCTRSRNTGKLRTVSRDGKQVLFFRAEDGLFSLKYHGGEILHGAVASPAFRVVCTDDAVPFVSAGKSLFARFVAEADGAIRPGDECLVVDGTDRLVAVGRALLIREEMLSFRKGVAVEIREGRSSSSSSPRPEGTR